MTTVRTTLIVAMLATFGLTSPSTAQSADDAARTQHQETIQRVIRLERADAVSAARVAGEILSCRLAVDQSTNSIVLSGTPEEIERAMTLLAELDSEEAHEEKNRIPARMVQLKRPVPDEFLDLLRQAARRARVAYDERTGKLVLHGNPDDIDVALQLVDIMQLKGEAAAPAKSGPLQVSFYFIQGVLSDRSEKPAPKQEDTMDEKSRREAALNDAVKQSLERMVAVNFDRQALEEVINRLAEMGGFNVSVIWPELESVGISRDDNVSVRVREAVPLRKVLETVLEQAGGGEVSIAYVVDEGILFIAREAYFENVRHTEVYDVHELIMSAPGYAIDALQPQHTDAGTVGQNSFSGGGDAGGGGMGGGGFGGGGFGGGGHGGAAGGWYFTPTVRIVESRSDPIEERTDQLLEVIRGTVTPDEWLENGGTFANISAIGGQLVITHHQKAHEAIADLLAKLKAEQVATVSAVSYIPLPASLKPVAEALAETGFHRPSLLALLMTRVQGDEEFEIQGRAEQMNRDVKAQIQGFAERLSDDRVQLRIEASMSRPAPPSLMQKPDEVTFEINTVLEAKLGDTVVLAASPGATDYGQAIALAVRVDEAN